MRQMTQQDIQDAAVFPPNDYSDIEFINCHFEGMDISKYNFSACVFRTSNLSQAQIAMTGFNQIHFIECKLIGLHFEACNQLIFKANFTQCDLRYASFYQLKMKRSRFITCNLQEVDFTEADLSESVFRTCNFEKAVFDRSVLTLADFSGSENYCIDPEQNNIRGGQFDLRGLPGLLEKYQLKIDL